MKINIIRIVLILLLLGTFYIIFGFSSQDSNTSTGISMKVSRFIIDIIYKNENDVSKNVKAKAIEHFIRKLAHFSIYTVVGVLLICLLCTYSIKNSNRILFSQIIGIIYAVSDEIHQSFVSGRSSQFSDVILDSLGVLFGICIVILIRKIIKRNSD